jgi:Xaa-Pro aminopeptidase
MSFGKIAVDWEERINLDRMRRERVERAKMTFKKQGLEAALLLHSDNVRYVGGGDGVHMWHGVSGYRYVLFFAEKGETVLYEAGMRKNYMEQALPWCKVDYAIPIMPYLADNTPEGVYQRQLEKFANQIKASLKEQGLSKEVLGIDTNSPAVINALKKVGIETSLKCSKAMVEARKIKTKDEVECLRMAASIAEAIFSEFKKVIRPGVTEMQLRAIATYTAYMAGADWASAPDINSGPHTSQGIAIQCSDRAIRPGDLIAAALCNISYNGYKTCYYRTFSCGKPTEAQKDAYKKALDLLYNAINAIKPGATTKDIAEKWPKAQDMGLAKRSNEDAAVLMQWGHGIGLGLYETPVISRIWSLDFPERLEPGMTLALETLWPTEEKSYEYPYGQAVRIEEMLHVTETGVEVLSKWPVDEITVCEI